MHYPKRGNGRPPNRLKRMLRAHFVEHWFNLTDFACNGTLDDSTSVRRLAGIDLGCEAVPDATTLLKFRRLLGNHTLGEKLFAQIGRVSLASGFKLNSDTIADATLIAATRDFTNQHTCGNGVVDEVERRKNRNKSKIRARVDLVFTAVKGLWDFIKIRYRGRRCCISPA
ncbi:hypothetical protein WJ90_30175 [Burkholderia ubonensis]|nr:hypothetical protein WJ90_30175 [Burkholderia ubonensis]KVR45492.1 hypothetical protein WK16_08760 [Burkholderia ubonensis]KVW28565.1 hypothetical protein WK94_08410 [Burkholderia ubonensis]